MENRKEIIRNKITSEQHNSINSEFDISSHFTRCVTLLRKRAIWFEDDYYNVVADEMKRIYNLMLEARIMLISLEDIGHINSTWDRVRNE